MIEKEEGSRKQEEDKFFNPRRRVLFV